MEITSDQAFRAMYYLLRDYFKNYKQTDDLGALLGTIDPFLWGENKPIDPGTVYDWNACIKNMSENYTGSYLFSIEKSFEIMLNYLEFYITQYGFDFKEVICNLKNNPMWKEKWQIYVEKAALD